MDNKLLTDGSHKGYMIKYRLQIGYTLFKDKSPIGSDESWIGHIQIAWITNGSQMS